MHPRVSVSSLCFPALGAVQAVEAVGRLGVGAMSLTGRVLREAGPDAVAAACRRHAVAVTTATGSLALDPSSAAALDASLSRAREDVDLAAAVGARSVYGLPGPRGAAEWKDRVEAFADAAGPLVAHAARRGVTLAVEPVNWLYADLGFVHSFHDAIAVARRSGLGVCLDLFHVWTEGGLREEIAENVDLITHVQLSDMTPGARALPCRTVPGQGIVPLAGLVEQLLEAGYQGTFDCELNGPDIDAFGHAEAAAQSARWLDALLTRLGA
ncbi:MULTISPECIES: sugar phosphate isomerase/epimerase [Streptacidiphilus]|uniref:Sugar phosphate isomerase/epimerase family protein n=1 Tax=Streptacidiphilus cavernicola TaxID=3342716 RepID=A0ABV6UUW9_9ACTN|nr:sugar phosphate isomerase/epimerase family protein [Streptacidiphilus jeojiense]